MDSIPIYIYKTQDHVVCANSSYEPLSSNYTSMVIKQYASNNYLLTLDENY